MAVTVTIDFDHTPNRAAIVHNTPSPSAVWLLGSGFIGLVGGPRSNQYSIVKEQGRLGPAFYIRMLR
jgi:hypothetical protein